MNEQDEVPFTEWLFYVRKHRRRRTTHTTRTISTNTQENNK